jgi:hypothetical protein
LINSQFIVTLQTSKESRHRNAKEPKSRERRVKRIKSSSSSRRMQEQASVYRIVIIVPEGVHTQTRSNPPFSCKKESSKGLKRKAEEKRIKTQVVQVQELWVEEEENRKVRKIKSSNSFRHELARTKP